MAGELARLVAHLDRHRSRDESHPYEVSLTSPEASARQNPRMVVGFVFAGLAVADYAIAYEWYVGLLGRGADMFPHEKESVWRLTPTSSIYVVEDRERAGSSLVTLALDDLDAYERRPRDGEFSFSEEVDGGAPRRLVVRDNDGNTLTFFQTPHPRACDPSSVASAQERPSSQR